MRRWLTPHGKLKTRSARHPQTIEIIVSRTGRASHVFRINLNRAMRLAGVLISLVLAWFTGTFYIAYTHVANREALEKAAKQSETIAKLQRHNERLVKEKQQMADTLYDLQFRVEQLASRVFEVVKHSENRFPVERVIKNQGGIGIPVGPDNVSVIWRAEANKQEVRLDRLLSTLEKTTARELARPIGYPIVRAAEISSDYGLRKNPFGLGYEFHNGIDFSVEVGTPILATGPGIVVEVGYYGTIGNRVSIDHGFGYRSVYGHLSRITVKQGEHVKRGQVIGFSGNTGRSSGPHLHYTIYYKGETVDPVHYLGVD